MFDLRAPSPTAWLQAVLGDFDTFLQDHAAAERKASASALQLVAHYRDKPEFVDEMVALAVEELQHFEQVYALLRRRGVPLGSDEKDEYVRGLRQHMRVGSPHYFLDRLVVAAIVEARGCERFGQIAAALPAGELRDFYADITRSESRHHALFLRAAKRYFAPELVQSTLHEWLDREVEVMRTLPIRSALH